MDTVDKVKRFVVNPDKRASSKARRFYMVLSGKPRPKRITNGELQKLIDGFSEIAIGKARKHLRDGKKATKYQRELCVELGTNNATSLCRGAADKFIAACKRERPDDFREAKEKLRGFTYKDE